MLNRQRVGLIFLFFMPALWQVQMVKPTLFSNFLWDGCGFSCQLSSPAKAYLVSMLHEACLKQRLFSSPAGYKLFCRVMLFAFNSGWFW
jgi:hypothetical protein